MKHTAFKIALAAAVMLCAGTAKTIAQTADQVLQRHADAVGGAEKWNKIKNIKITGTMSPQEGITIDVAQTVVNNKGMRSDISFMGKTGFVIVTPTEGWTYLPFQPGMDKVTALPADQVKLSKDKINIKTMQLTDRAELGTATLEGKDTINNLPCYKIKLVKDGNTQMAYIAADSYYLLRVETTAKIADDQEQEVVINYGNYQKQADGILFPMLLGTAMGDVTVKQVEINKTLPDDIFSPAVPK